MKNMRRRKIVSSVALNVVIAVLAMLWLVPVFWLVVSSFRAEQGAYTSYLWPKSFTFGNYVRLFTDRKLFDFPRWFGNTMLVAGCSCAITTILVLMVAYVYSRLRFPSRKFLMNASLVLGMFPGFMSMIAGEHSKNHGNIHIRLTDLKPESGQTIGNRQNKECCQDTGTNCYKQRIQKPLREIEQCSICKQLHIVCRRKLFRPERCDILSFLFSER